MAVEYTCPVCGAETKSRSACPGYGGRDGERIMVCSIPCGNADEFRCTARACGWWYREPNRRGERDMGVAPAWLQQWLDAFAPPPEDDVP